MINRDTLVRYAELKLKIADLEAELDMLKPLIMEDIPLEGVDLDGYGSFSIVPKRTWTYPNEVELARKNVKEMEKVSQQIGTASYTESPYLMFRVKR